MLAEDHTPRPELTMNSLTSRVLRSAITCAAFGLLPLTAQDTPKLQPHEDHAANPSNGKPNGLVPRLVRAEDHAAPESHGKPEARFSLELKGSVPFAAAVEELRQTAERHGTQLPNIIVDPEANDRPVGELRLSNVTGADALTLLATAAGCKSEPIINNGSGETIGLRVIAGPPSFQAGDSRRSISLREMDRRRARATADAPPIEPGGGGGSSFGGSGIGSGVPGHDPFGGSDEVAAPGLGDPFGGGSGAMEPTVVTRVYPVASMLATMNDDSMDTKIEVLQDTLLQIVQPAKPDFAFHRQAQILVCKGAPEVQDLVQQTLAAMRENAREKTDTEKMGLMQQLEAAKREIQMLHSHVEQLERMRHAEREAKETH